MTSYSHTVTFQDNERIAIENMVKDAIKEFRSDPANQGVPVPWVLESILEKFNKANMEFLSWTDTSGVINIRNSD